MNLFDYVDLINNKPMHIATVNSNNNPNLAVAGDVRVIEDNKIIISINEMNNTPKNIEYNPNIVITIFDEEWVGLRLFGKGKVFLDGKYYDYCKNTFFANNEVTPSGATEPKGAIVVTIEKLEEYK